MTVEERVAELEASLLRTQAKMSGHAFIFNFVLSAMLKDHPQVGRDLANLAKRDLTPTALPPSFATKPEFAQMMAAAARAAIDVLIDPYSSEAAP